MKIDLSQSTFGLHRDGVIVLEDAHGTRVSCLRGALWLTQEGYEDDIVLEQGDSIVLSSDGVTLVTALRESEVEVSKGRAGHPRLRRLASWLPRSLSRMLPSH